MKVSKSSQSNLHERILPIVNLVTRVLNLHYLQNIVGHTHAVYLLYYLVGLLVVDRNPTMVRISRCLKNCYHDGLFRMLGGMNLTMAALSGVFICFIEKLRRPKVKGWLILDDTSIAKRFSRKIGFCSKVWCGCVGKITNGIVFVTLLWTDGRQCLPVGFLVWMSRKDRQGKVRRNHKSKIDLARELIVDNIEFCKSCEYLVFDGWYCSKKFLNLMRGLNIHCVSSLKKNRNIVFKRREMKVADLSVGFRGMVYLKGYGDVFIYCAKFGATERCLVSTDKRLKYKQLRKRYKRRWPIEEFFRTIKQNLGLCVCQCRKHTATVNHISAVFLAYVVLETLRADYDAPHGQIKNFMIEKFYGHDEKIAPLSARRAMLKHVA